MNTDIQLSAHFHLREFLHQGSPDGLTPEILQNLRALAEALEGVRTLCGNRPITVTSGFRTVAHNRAVGGVPERPGKPGSGSQHLYGRAADIVVSGLPANRVQSALSNWPGGLGRYVSFTHVDIGPKRRWNGP